MCGGGLAKLVDAGVPVGDAAVLLGISPGRCYAILRATGRPAGASQSVSGDVDAAQVAVVFTATGSINQAAKACGVSRSGLRGGCWWPKVWSQRPGNLLGRLRPNAGSSSCSPRGGRATRAAREVSIHERTGRDWRDGIRKVRNTRVLADGTVIDYTTGTRYTQPVNTKRSRGAHTGVSEVSSRYLSLPDRLAIADGLQARHTLTMIAARIGKHTSTVSPGDR